MQYGNTVIRDPLDFPEFRDANWRAETASLWANHERDWRPHRAYRDDEYIVEYKQFIQRYRLGKHDYEPVDEKSRRYQLVSRWAMEGHCRAFRFFLEPMLLTSAPMKEIVVDLVEDQAVSLEDVRTYAKLFYDVRNKDDELVKSYYYLLRTALGNVVEVDRNTPQERLWKYYGCLFGYPQLGTILRLKNISDRTAEAFYLEDLYREARILLMTRTVAGEVGNATLTSQVENYIEYRKMLQAGQGGSMDGLAMMLAGTVSHMLELAKPHMLNPAMQDVLSMEKSQKIIDTRIEAQKGVLAPTTADSQSRLEGTAKQAFGLLESGLKSQVR